MKTSARTGTPMRARGWGRRAGLAVVTGATALAVLASTGSPGAAASGTAREPIPVLPALPEVGISQFGSGVTHVDPVAKPATDMGARLSAPQGQRSSTGEAIAAGTYACSGFGGVDRSTSPYEITRDIYEWGGFAAYRVGNGAGDVNWRLNPYNNPSWYMWLHSLRWLGQGIMQASTGDVAMLDRVGVTIQDWIRDNPYSWKGDVGAWESTMHRTNVLVCYRHAVLNALGVTTLPAKYAWVDTSLRNHATFLVNNWSGAWNHGTDESLVLFGVGCLLERQDYRDLAVSRLEQGITTSIDSQGSTNEQSTAYAQFNYHLWGRAEEVLRACGTDPGSTIGQRRTLMATWLAHATNSLGAFHQIGDSEVVRTSNAPGTPIEYPATNGASGTPPTTRTAAYSRGYVFGRTTWGDARTTFRNASSYSIRYGPPRALHGHNDHTAITYTSRGRDVVIDSGHAGYQNDQWRVWAKSRRAHSSLATPLSPEAAPTTTLRRSLVASNWEFYEFADSPAAGINRTRAVTFLRDPDLFVTLDRASSTTAQQFQTNWHLPSDESATIYSRTTAISQAPGAASRTILFQLPYKQALPPGALLVQKGQTSPIQGWHYPNITQRKPAPNVLLARSGYSASILSFVVPVGPTAGVGYAVRQVGTSTVIDLTVEGKKVSVSVSAGGAISRL